MKKVLVTGAGGFVGSHLTEALIRKGIAVKAFVHYNSFNSWGWLDRSAPEIKNAIEVVAGDVCDPFGVKKAMQGCDQVFHLAALIGIPYSYHSPGAYIDTNVKGTLNVVQAARELKIDRVIHTSTSEVYGTALSIPITEEHPLQGQSPYSASKIGADQIALSFYASFGTPVSVIRPFNAYGPRQSLRAVIPTIIAQIANGAPKLKLGSIHPTRDFNFVMDLVNAFIKMSETDAAVGEVLNIGSNYEISIGETAELIAELMEADIDIVEESERIRPKNSEVERLWADNSKAKKIIGWEPRYAQKSGFKRGLSETIKWFREYGDLDKEKSSIYTI